MTDEKTNSEAGVGEHTDGHIEMDMDSTRMDIQGSFSNPDATRTSIRVDIGREETLDQPIKPKKNIVADLTQALQTLFNRFSLRFKKKAPSNIKTVTKNRITPLTQVWIPHPDFPLIHKIIFYLSRVLIVVAGFYLLEVQAQSLFHYFSNPLYYKWVFLALFMATILPTLFLLIAKKSPAWFVCLPLLGLTLHILLHFYFFKIFEAGLFKMGGLTLPQLIPFFWAVVGVFEIAVILFVYPRAKVGKVILAFIVALVFSEAFYLALNKTPIEMAWQGLGFFSHLPYLFVRPIFLMLHVIFPLLFFISLISFSLNRRDKRLLAWVGGNLLLTVGLSALGLFQLANSGVPGLLSLVIQNAPYVGVSELDNKGLKITFNTSNYETMKNRDDVDRLKIKITSFDPQKFKFPKPVKEAFFIKAEDQLGTPVYFLERSQFILKAGGEKIAQWYFEDAPMPEGEDKEWGYVAGFNLPELTPRVVVTSLDEAGNIRLDTPITFEKKPDSVPLTSYEIKIDGNVVDGKPWTGEDLVAVAWPTLEPGDHELTVKVLADKGAESTQSFPFVVNRHNLMEVLSPMSGDFFAESLTVALSIRESAALEKIEILLDDKLVENLTQAPFVSTLDTKATSDGPHTLKIIVHPAMAGGANHPNDLQKIIPLVKGVPPVVNFTSPSLGEYVGDQFAVAVETPETGVDTLELFMDGTSVQKISQPPYNFSATLPEKSDSSTHQLTVVLKTKDGRQASSSVNIEAGMGQIEALGELGGLSKIVFVMDASISNWDMWEGKQKWDWMRQVFRSPGLQAKLKNTQVGVVMFGGESSFSQNNCKDASWVMPFDDFKKTAFYTFANKLKPKGVSALYAGLAKASSEKPQKIIVLADGGDSCAVKPPTALLDLLVKNKTAVDVVLLGDVAESQQKVLIEMAGKTKGDVISVIKGDTLTDEVSGLLASNYELYRGDELVLRSAINGKPQDIKPGDYTLRLSAGLNFTDMPITVKNGLKSKIELKKEGEAISGSVKTETVQGNLE